MSGQTAEISCIFSALVQAPKTTAMDCYSDSLALELLAHQDLPPQHTAHQKIYGDDTAPRAIGFAIDSDRYLVLGNGRVYQILESDKNVRIIFWNDASPLLEKLAQIQKTQSENIEARLLTRRNMTDNGKADSLAFNQAGEWVGHYYKISRYATRFGNALREAMGILGHEAQEVKKHPSLSA